MTSSRSRVRFSRRVFIQRLTFFGGGVVLIGGAACKRQPARLPAASVAEAPSADAGGRHSIFTDEEWAIVSAACERVIPKDEDPGATEAGVPEYIERMLQTPELASMKEHFLAGTDALGRRAVRMFGNPFYQLPASQQDEVLTVFKDSAEETGEAHYFELLLTLSLEGLLGDPSYGGNKNRAGWALVGFGTSEPPPNYDGTQHLHSHRAR